MPSAPIALTLSACTVPWMEVRERYFDLAEAEWPVRRAGNLRFYVDYLFEGVDLRGARVLDIGAGGGRYSFYAAAAGAARVVALEPEAAGSGARGPTPVRG